MKKVSVICAILICYGNFANAQHLKTHPKNIIHSNDAGVIGISKQMIFTDSSSVLFILKNYGKNNLKSVTLKWSINNQEQSPYHWVGNLKKGAFAVVKVGKYNFSHDSNYIIKGSVILPNKHVDENLLNDNYRKYEVLTPLATGTYTVGATNCDFSSLEDAIFAVNGGLTGSAGPTTLLLMDATNTINAPPLTINSVTTATNTLTIKPNTGVTSVISGSSTSSIIKINAAGYVTIDGSNNGSSSRNLTIINTDNTHTTGTAVVWLASSSTSGSTNNTIKNCIVNGSAKDKTQMGIFCGGSTIGTSSMALTSNSNNSFINNSISKSQNGIYVLGKSTSTLDNGLVINNNLFGSAATDDGFISSGITIYNQTNAGIQNNDIQNFVYNGPIGLLDGQSHKINLALYLKNSTNTTIAFNKIHYILFYGTTTARTGYGISLESPSFNTSSAQSNNHVYNNMIYDCRNTGGISTSWLFSGINENGGYGDQYYFNSVDLSGAFTPNITTNYYYAAFSNGNTVTTTASPVLDIRNNIFNINMVTASSTSNFYCHYSKLSSSTSNTWDYNDLYYDPALGNGNKYAGFFNNNSCNFSQWQSATLQDAHSVNVTPQFVSATDLHLTGCNSGLESKGVTISSPINITTDIDGDVRQSTPDIGADEFMGGVVSWIGVSGNHWNTAANWCSNTVPDASTDVYIPLIDNTHEPVLYTSTDVRSISFGTGAFIDLNDRQLSVYGSFSGPGVLKGSAASGLAIVGSTATDAGTVNFDPTENQLLSLTVSAQKTLTLGSNLYINGGTTGNYGTVTVGDVSGSSGTLHTSGYLTLGSNVNGTAQVAPSKGIIDGNVTVETYIPPRRAWRFLCVPFSLSSQTIQADWQEGAQSTLAANVNPHPGYGTHITWDPSHASSSGFDQNITSNPSCKIWTNSTTSSYGWLFSVPATTGIGSLLTSFEGYSLFVRGSRGIDLNLGVNAIPDATILRQKGLLNIGDKTKTYSSVPAGHWFLVGNPYASSIDVTNVLTRSVNINTTSFYTWDPTLTGTYGAGAYVTHGGTGINMKVPLVSPFANENDNFIIQGEQAFLLLSTADPATVGFTENDKSTSETQVFGKSYQPFVRNFNPRIYINVLKAVNDSLIVLDGCGAEFASSYTTSVDSNDVPKLGSSSQEIIYFIRDNHNIAIETRPVPTSSDTLFVQLKNMVTGSYTLQGFAKSVPDGSNINAFLIDRYLNLRDTINLHDSVITSYTFNVTSDTNTFRNRFIVILSPGSDSLKAGGEITKSFAQATSLKNAAISIYPNPVQNNTFTIKFDGFKKEKYELQLSNAKGEILMHKFINVENKIENFAVDIDKAWPNGIYIANIIDKKQNIVHSEKVFIARQ